jgi:hypothetical protein
MKSSFIPPNPAPRPLWPVRQRKKTKKDPKIQGLLQASATGLTEQKEPVFELLSLGAAG